jgi:2-oxo-4-hydroxy-4-carboxy-5-ureidoimidazoline decarboxylase
VSLASFNAATAAGAQAAMLSCCASRAFARAMAARRPYADVAALETAIGSVFETLTWDDVLEAMAAHPRIGDRAAGQSAAEQAGVADSSRAALLAGNLAYEERFGHVFLICASGLGGEDMLASLRDRLASDPASERATSTAELRKITVLRARKLAGP